MSLVQIVSKLESTEILILKIRNTKQKKITWHESVIDNEHMNKRKSNICCIFHKKQDFSDSSCDEDTSDSDNE